MGGVAARGIDQPHAPRDRRSPPLLDSRCTPAAHANRTEEGTMHENATIVRRAYQAFNEADWTRSPSSWTRRSPRTPPAAASSPATTPAVMPSSPGSAATGCSGSVRGWASAVSKVWAPTTAHSRHVRGAGAGWPANFAGNSTRVSPTPQRWRKAGDLRRQGDKRRRRTARVCISLPAPTP